MPIISIIIPIYNVAPYLRECLDSIQEQTFKDFEAILIDDGSTDGSGQICDWYASKYKRFKVIHKSNGGVSSARNMGLDIAQGKYIGFIDPDDYISPDFYELLLNAIQSNDADISISGEIAINQAGKEIPWLKKLLNQIKKETIEGKQMMIEYTKFKIAATLFDKLYLSSLFDGIRLPENINLMEDGATMPLILSRARRVVMEPQAIYYYRRRNGSLTNSKIGIERASEMFTAVDIMTKRIKEVCPEAKEHASFLNFLYKEAATVMLFTKK